MVSSELGKDFIPTNMHTAVNSGICVNFQRKHDFNQGPWRLKQKICYLKNVLLEIGFGLALKLKSSSRNRNDDKLIFGKSYSIPIGLLRYNKCV